MKIIKNKLKKYLNKNMKYNRPNIFYKIKSFFHCDEYIENTDDKISCSNEIKKQDELNNSNIDKYINNHKKYNDFQTMLFNFIDSKNLKDCEVYNKVHIDRRLFSKIRSDKNYHPSKETVILLSISLELNENELDKLLESASYSLPKNNKYDLIIRFCFINKIYKITNINELLSEYNCKLFNY